MAPAEPIHPPADAATAVTWNALRQHTAPAAFTEAVAGLLLEEVDRGRPILDVGAGSGQLARALTDRGASVIALDLSVPMLELVPRQLVRVAADATRLPLAAGSVGAALAAHVLHVVPAWPEAIAELDRVVGPAGVVLVQSAPSSGVLGGLPELRAVYRGSLPARALVGSEVAGPDGDRVLERAFAVVGRTAHDLPTVKAARQETARGVIGWMQGNPWTWPGPTTDEERSAAAGATEVWAAGAGIDLDEPFETTTLNRWRAYRRL